MIRILLFVSAVLAATFAKAEVQIQEIKTDAGITAWLVEEHSIPIVSVEVRFKGGTALDAPGKRGAINLMVGLLEEGAADMNAREFAAAQEALAASFDYDAYNDSIAISAEFLTENKDAAIELLRKALQEPRFDEDAVERVRAQVLSIIRSDDQDPAKIANRRFNQLAFGDHPYGSSQDGTIESVGALTRGDIVDAHARVLARDRAFVGVVGDISPDEAKELIDALLSGLPATGAEMPDDAEFLLGGGKTVVPFPTPQSVAVFGHRGITRDDPDFFEAYVLNQILGGANFGSRLMEEVREKRGLTYGVYSYLVPMDHGQLYLGQVASANDRIAQAIEVIKEEWRKAVEGVTDKELEDAKTYLTGAYPLRFDGNGRIANILVGMQIEGLPIDYIATRNDKVNAVSLEGIRRVAKRILKPDELHFVIVGQPEGIEASN